MVQKTTRFVKVGKGYRPAWTKYRQNRTGTGIPFDVRVRDRFGNIPRRSKEVELDYCSHCGVDCPIVEESGRYCAICYHPADEKKGKGE